MSGIERRVFGVRLIIPLQRHPNAGDGLSVVWQDQVTHDAVLETGAGFIVTLGVTGAAFIDTFDTEADARAALIEHRGHGHTPLRE
jgi:hypothetical protein